MRLLHRLTVAGAAAGLILTGATPAFAAAPSNDTVGGAIAIDTLPYDVTMDTTEATTDADDDAANPSNCGAPATDASVWFSLTPTTDEAYLVDVSKSDYSSGVLVVSGQPGDFTFVTCGAGAVAFEATAGTTYLMTVIDDQLDGNTANGGTLRLHAEVAPPPPTVDLTVNPTGTYDRQTGYATVSGTAFCSGVSEFSGISGELRQPVGRAIVVGYFDLEFACDGAWHKWTAEVEPYYPGTKFGRGGSVSMTWAFACGPVLCSDTYVEQDVLLRVAR